jgi:hypothetical protein
MVIQITTVEGACTTDTRVLHAKTYVANSIGAALDEYAPDPRQGSEFIVQVIATGETHVINKGEEN